MTEKYLELNTVERNYQIRPEGIVFTGDVSPEEWKELGTQLGKAGRTLGFLIGDWLNYGEGKGPRFYGAKDDETGEKDTIYTPAMKITGLEYKTLAEYSCVARKVKFSIRMENLSFGHHQKIAYLKTDEEKQKWLRIAAQEQNKQKNKPMSVRRLAKSIILGRVARPDEVSTPKGDRGIDNVHPHVNRLIAFWAKMKHSGFIDNAETEQITTMIEDLMPVVKIIEELQHALAQRRGGGPAGSHID